MDDLTVVILTTFGSVLASSGFWAYMSKKGEHNTAQSQMLKGLGHDKIMYLCDKYIKRGWITPEEYEDLYDYLYSPYEKCKGNGSAKREMDKVKLLPRSETEYLNSQIRK